MSDTGLSPGDATAQLRAKDRRIIRLEAELDWWHDRDPSGWGFYKLLGGGRETDTSGEASPTRVASPPPAGFTPIWPGLVPEEHQLCCSYTPELVRRIRALEAELAERDGKLERLHALWKDAFDRAEKAEAEVERLREERDPWKYHGRSAEEWEHEAQRLSEKMDSLVSAFGEKMAHPRRVNPTSDTLGLEAKG